ncbi:MAG: hypothetical protein K2O22_03795 [Anaeroplasmataceae bacterium]|nr:hypothetical protein [Anaeroplasmataceae bacterium]
METESSLIEIINPEIKFTKENTIFFWKIYCKKSWSFYLITGLFTMAFVIWYLLYPSLFLLYTTIIYPLLMVIYFFLGGLYKNICYKKRLCSQMKDATIEIHSTFISFQVKQNGSTHMSRYAYDTMKKMEYNESTKRFIFTINSNNFLSLDKDDVQQETFDFLISKINH